MCEHVLAQRLSQCTDWGAAHLYQGNWMPVQKLPEQCHLPRRSSFCSNHVSAQEEINHALTHELIHAYDHCRAANLDWRNCEHHACRHDNGHLILAHLG